MALTPRQRQSSNGVARDRIQREPREQDEAGIAVRLEHRQAIDGIVDVEPCDLPDEVRGEDEKPEREDQPSTGAEAGPGDQRDGKRVEYCEHRLGALAEEQCGRLDADQRIVLAILVRVDGVVANHPGYGAGIEQQGGRIELGERRRPSHQRAPGEGEAEHDLRPVGDPLHEGINDDHRERGEPDIDRETIELQQHREPDQRLQHEKGGGGGDRHLPGRNGSQARALDARIEIAIDDIVPGAAGSPHGEGADEEQNEVPDVDAVPRVNRGERNGPPARHQKQPGADWPVEARQPQIGAGWGRGEAVDPVTGRIGDAPRAAAHRAKGLPVSVSKVDCGFFVPVEASGTMGVVPRASLRVGPAGRAPCTAISQTFLLTSEALPCPSLTCLRTSGGTPQVALCSCKPLSILLSAARKALKSLHISSGGAFFSPAACNALPCLAVSSRLLKSCWQPGGGCCGAPNDAAGAPGDVPGAGDIPGEPGMPGIPPNWAAAGHNGITTSASANGKTRLSLICVPRPRDSTLPDPGVYPTNSALNSAITRQRDAPEGRGPPVRAGPGNCGFPLLVADLT